MPTIGRAFRVDAAGVRNAAMLTRQFSLKRLSHLAGLLSIIMLLPAIAFGQSNVVTWKTDYNTFYLINSDNENDGRLMRGSKFISRALCKSAAAAILC